MTTTVINNVRVVTPGRLLESGSVAVAGGRIVEVADTALPSGDGLAIDGAGLLLTPGLIDTHSDGLEKEISPRRTSRFPLDFALRSFETRVRSAGVTTVCHGVAYQQRPDRGRSVEASREIVDVIDDRRHEVGSGVDHRLLYRTEARDAEAVDPLLVDLDAGRTGGSDRVLVSFEDHTPGQGQFRNVEQYEAAVDPTELPPGVSVKEYVAQLMRDAETRLAVRESNRSKLAAYAKADGITLLAHDVESPDDVAAAAEMGAIVAEFPLTLEAAAAAREAGMSIVMGAPNALRGGSHSGNASAREMIAEGLCDVLASDYMPTTLLGAAISMVDQGVLSTVDAIRLVTTGPADMLGLSERGRIEVGAEADLILIDDRGAWPVVVGVRRSADDLAWSTQW